MLPVTLTTWEEWRRRHTGTTAVQTSEGFEERRDSWHEQAVYLTSMRDAMFPMAMRDDRMSPKAWVFGVRSGDTPKTYPWRPYASSSSSTIPSRDETSWWSWSRPAARYVRTFRETALFGLAPSSMTPAARDAARRMGPSAGSRRRAATRCHPA